MAVTLYLTAGPGGFHENAGYHGPAIRARAGRARCLAETCLLITRLAGWDLETYETWLITTWTRLSAAPPRA